VAQLKLEELLGLAEKSVGLTLKNGAAEAEVYTYQGFGTSVGIERGQIVRSSRIVDGGLGIRSVVNKAVGFAYTNILEDKSAIEEAAAKSVGAAKAGKPDADWRGFPGKKPYSVIKHGYDKRVVDLRAEDLVRIAARMLSEAEATDKRALAVEGGASASHLYGAIANSNGVAGADRASFVECSLATVGNDKGEVSPVCFEFNLDRCFCVHPEWVGKEAARLAVSALKAKSIETKNTSVIFVQTALQELFAYTLINAVKADFVQRNQSAFKGKIGEKVASEVLSIYDDGLLEGGLRTGMFDGEGVPQQKTPIIEKGVLRGFIYDNYTARKDGRESTGNASRAGYLSTPSVEATNFHVVSGRKSADELVRDVDDGLIVYSLQGAHSSNPASGEFSVVAAPAWHIEKGVISYAVKGAMLSGNVFDLIKNVTTLANNTRQAGVLVAPWVLVENVKVVGK
jgi:PmbA protein